MKRCSVGPFDLLRAGESATSRPRPKSRGAALFPEIPRAAATLAWVTRAARRQDDFFNGLLAHESEAGVDAFYLASEFHMSCVAFQLLAFQLPLPEYPP